MTIERQISDHLAKMENFLSKQGEIGWANLIKDIREGLSLSRFTASAIDIRSLFGGAGTLNDLVLSKDGIILQNENSELERLRETLYRLSFELQKLDT